MRLIGVFANSLAKYITEAGTSCPQPTFVGGGAAAQADDISAPVSALQIRVIGSMSVLVTDAVGVASGSIRAWDPAERDSRCVDRDIAGQV